MLKLHLLLYITLIWHFRTREKVCIISKEGIPDLLPAQLNGLLAPISCRWLKKEQFYLIGLFVMGWPGVGQEQRWGLCMYVLMF